MKKQDIRKGFEWYRMLTKKQQKRFRLETHRQRGLARFHKIMNSQDTYRGFIASGFIFKHSYKGLDYWHMIYYKN